MSLEIEKGNWHLRKDVNIATVVILFGGVCSGIFFASEVEHRLLTVEKYEKQHRLDRTELKKDFAKEIEEVVAREALAHSAIHKHITSLKENLKSDSRRIEEKVDFLIERAMKK
jgi:hypothetical protein